MTIEVLSNDMFTALEEKLCTINAQDDSADMEYAWLTINNSFKNAFKEFSESTGDFELVEWHQEVRRLWVFIYTKDFYNPSSIERICNLKSRFPNWFIELECYSNKTGRNELLGWLLVHENGMAINESFLEYGELELKKMKFSK